MSNYNFLQNAKAETRSEAELSQATGSATLQNLFCRAKFLAKNPDEKKSSLVDTYRSEDIELFGKDMIALAENTALEELRLESLVAQNIEVSRKVDESASSKGSISIRAYLLGQWCRLKYSGKMFCHAWIYGWECKKKLYNE